MQGLLVFKSQVYLSQDDEIAIRNKLSTIARNLGLDLLVCDATADVQIQQDVSELVEQLVVQNKNLQLILDKLIEVK